MQLSSELVFSTAIRRAGLAVRRAPVPLVLLARQYSIQIPPMPIGPQATGTEESLIPLAGTFAMWSRRAVI